MNRATINDPQRSGGRASSEGQRFGDSGRSLRSRGSRVELQRQTGSKGIAASRALVVVLLPVACALWMLAGCGGDDEYEHVTYKDPSTPPPAEEVDPGTHTVVEIPTALCDSETVYRVDVPLPAEAMVYRPLILEGAIEGVADDEWTGRIRAEFSKRSRDGRKGIFIQRSVRPVRNEGTLRYRFQIETPKKPGRYQFELTWARGRKRERHVIGDGSMKIVQSAAAIE